VISGPSRRLSTGGPWEETFGYSRAVRVGDQIHVSGCTSVVDGQVLHPDDAGAQARVALDAALDAVASLGGSVGDVVRTRMYVLDRADCEPVGLAHGERMGGVRPAATMVLVAGLLDPAMRVEIEVDAVVTVDRAAGQR
jgi:enamine deaminase RidA (YjgF/YER057c/UK114 family)